MLLNAKEGRSGPLLQGLYKPLFSCGGVRVIGPPEDGQDGEDHNEKVKVVTADLHTTAAMKQCVVHGTRDDYKRRNILFMIWLFDHYATCCHLIEPTIFEKK